MNIPVDGIVISSNGLLVNEAAMTGESDDLKKESVDQCKEKMEEREEENAYHK